MTVVTVRRRGTGEPMEFDVEVGEGGGATRHRVSLSAASHAALAGGAASPEDVIRAAFAFLLDREPKESILARFDVMVIGRYFPEFGREIGRYLGATR